MRLSILWIITKRNNTTMYNYSCYKQTLQLPFFNVIMYKSPFLSHLMRSFMFLVDDHRLVGGDEVLDVNEGVLPAMHLQLLQSLNNQLAQVHAFPLAIVETIT